jgi:exodeoxyribonuclease V alpha subunit
MEDEIADPSLVTQEILQKIKGVVAKSLPALGFKKEDITVLSPMQRGVVGVRNLNTELQSIVNAPSPEKKEHQRAGMVLREGDRVMQRRNNYDKNVFNGDIGYILQIDSEEQTVSVEYPEGPIEYEFAETDELSHAFALTTHKAQGSEYPACVIIVHTTHFMMLQRNLVYTALTRAKKFAVFVGTKKALGIAVRNKHVKPRHTRLSLRLQNLVEGLEVGPARDLSAPPLPGRLF